MGLRSFFLSAMVVLMATLCCANPVCAPIERDTVMALADPLSPRHDEEALVASLQQLLADGRMTNADRLWCEAMLEMATRNRVGEVCNDLEYVTVEGAKGHLHGIESELTLLFFNDPDCLSCHQVKERLDTCETLRVMVSRHELTVVALCVGDEEEKWRVEEYPDYVVNAFDMARAVENEEVYDLPTMPLFYLLDTDKRVLLKNEPSLNRVVEVLKAKSRYRPARR